MEDSKGSWSNDVQMDLKPSAGGIIFVLQPSDDPADPLNWSMSRKIVILSVVSRAGFICVAQSLANTSRYFAQAAVYHKLAQEISYSSSAATAGIASGLLFI
ncbi:hypothetical protein MMC29_007195 [Sticta canariensis]|nr:hypothetical protein [Sticta canariensis]